MAEVRCSVCGVLTPQTESCSFMLSPTLADGKAADETALHVVCSSCSSRLSEEIAKGGTTVLRPAGEVEGRQASPAKTAAPSSIGVVCDAEPGSSAVKPSPDPTKRDPARTEFEFARK